jgi:hypothetical protein
MSALTRTVLRARVAGRTLPRAMPRPLALTLRPLALTLPRQSFARLSTAAAPGPTPGPKWNATRILITAAVSLVAFGSAGWAWQLVE